jgi:23S rRNA G2445 N2-methylase RlmL
MCGSGTFLTEAMHWHTPLHLRNFAFETAPFYRGRILQVKKAPLVSPLPVSHALGFDLNTELIAKIRSSANLGLEVRAQDSLAAKLEVSGEYLMVCNPPYGERLGIKGKRGQFLREAREKFLTVDRPLRLGFLVPSDFDDLFPEIEAYRVHSKLAFRNGGLAVTFWVWERR